MGAVLEGCAFVIHSFSHEFIRSDEEVWQCLQVSCPTSGRRGLLQPHRTIWVVHHTVQLQTGLVWFRFRRNGEARGASLVFAIDPSLHVNSCFLLTWCWVLGTDSDWISDPDYGKHRGCFCLPWGLCSEQHYPSHAPAATHHPQACHPLQGACDTPLHSMSPATHNPAVPGKPTPLYLAV